MPMYQVKPIVDRHIAIDVPTCMYSYQIQAQRGSSGAAEHALQVTGDRVHRDRVAFKRICTPSGVVNVTFRGSETQSVCASGSAALRPGQPADVARRCGGLMQQHLPRSSIHSETMIGSTKNGRKCPVSTT